MRLVSILLFKWDGEGAGGDDKPLLLSSHIDVSFANFFLRNSLKEHILFHSRLVVERTGLNTRQSVEFDQDLGFCHCYVHPCGIAAAVLADKEYPQRVAFSLISKVMLEFTQKYPNQWMSINKDILFEFPEGDALLEKYKNPLEVDNILKVQRDLEQVTDVMLKNMNDLLRRGEELDDLIAKTDDLTKTSRDFYRTAKAQNQCCKYY